MILYYKMLSTNITTNQNYDLLVEMINDINIKNTEIINFLDNNNLIMLSQKMDLLVYNNNLVKNNNSDKYELLYYLIKNIYNLDTAIQYQELDKNIINKLVDDGYILDWKMISRHQNLDEQMLKMYKYELNWDIITKFKDLSSFLNDLEWCGIDFIFWKNIHYQNLKEEFERRI